MESSYIYALIYMINNKATIKVVSPNYAYVRRCKAVYDAKLGAKGAIKKMHKRKDGQII